MTVTGQRVTALTKAHGIEIDRDEAAFLANQFSRLAGVEGDETLELIAALMREDVLSAEQSDALTLAHVRERHSPPIT